MDERQYHERADATLQALQDKLDRLDAGFDFELAAGGIMEIEFDDGSMIVINKQAAAHEIWVAAKSGGFHYRWNGEAWQDTRSGEELLMALGRMMSAQAGEAISLV